MRKDTITELVVKFDEPCRVWILDAVFEFGSTEEIFAWSVNTEADLPPQEQLDADFIGLTLWEAKQLLINKYGDEPGLTIVSFVGLLAHFEDGTSVAATPDMLRALPDMYVLLQEIVAEANEYETYQFDEDYEFGPTTTIGRAQSIIDKIERG